MMRRAHHHRRRGFTLLELMVVGMIGTLIVAIIANLWRWYGKSVAEQQSAVMLAQEMKIASEAIAQDYGPALASRTLDGITVQIDIDSGNGVADWAAPDTVIQYAVANGILFRQDLTNTSTIAVASYMESMSAQVVEGHLEVTLNGKVRNTPQAV